MFYPWLSSNSADVIVLCQSKQVVGMEWRGEAKADNYSKAPMRKQVWHHCTLQKGVSQIKFTVASHLGLVSSIFSKNEPKQFNLRYHSSKVDYVRFLGELNIQKDISKLTDL